MSKNKRNTIYNARKTDYGIPTFSMKSAFIMMLAASVGTLVVPYLLSFINIDFKLGVILGNSVLTAYSVAYVRYFIESKKGYGKKFWLTYAGFAVSFLVIGTFWMYLDTYI